MLSPASAHRQFLPLAPEEIREKLDPFLFLLLPLLVSAKYDHFLLILEGDIFPQGKRPLFCPLYQEQRCQTSKNFFFLKKKVYNCI